MKRYQSVVGPFFFALLLVQLSACSKDPREKLYGTWKGTTKIEQNITITIRPDSTIEIDTQVDSVREIRKGTYTIVDRRLRIALTRRETYTGDRVVREDKVDQDEAVFTFTGENEMVLRKGTQAMILQRVAAPG